MREDILMHDAKIESSLHGAPWSRDEIKAAVACWRRMSREQAEGRAVDCGKRLAELAGALGRRGESVRTWMGLVAFAMDRYGLPAVDGIAPHPGGGRMPVETVLEVDSELEVIDAEAAGRDRWTEKQLRSAVEAYREIAGLEAGGMPVDAEDCVCRLAQASGHKFASARLRLANIAWLVKRREQRPIACIAAAGEMPDETMEALERLLDEGA